MNRMLSTVVARIERILQEKIVIPDLRKTVNILEFYLPDESIDAYQPVKIRISLYQDQFLQLAPPGTFLFFTASLLESDVYFPGSRHNIGPVGSTYLDENESFLPFDTTNGLFPIPTVDKSAQKKLISSDVFSIPFENFKYSVAPYAIFKQIQVNACRLSFQNRDRTYDSVVDIDGFMISIADLTREMNLQGLDLTNIPPSRRPRRSQPPGNGPHGPAPGDKRGGKLPINRSTGFGPIHIFWKCVVCDRTG